MFKRWNKEEKEEIVQFYIDHFLKTGFYKKTVLSTELEEELKAKFPRHSLKSIRKKLHRCMNVTFDDILNKNYHRV